MAVNVKTSSNTVNVRVGQASAVKVLSSAAGGVVYSETAKNVIGGIASVTALSVSGITTLGITSITDTLYVAGITTVAGLGGITTTGGDLWVGGALNTNDLSVAGIATFGTTSVVIDGNNDLINVGTALTLGSVQGVLTPNLAVAGISTFNDDVIFKGANTNARWDHSTSDLILYDSTRLEFGSNKDFEIWHGGSHTFLKNSGGDLRIRGDKILLKREDGTERYLEANVNSEVKLFFNGDEKFETTKEGVLVSGGTTTGTLSVTGVSTFAGIVTTTGDMYVGGDLYVLDDLILDEITSRNLNITGLSTFVGNAKFDSNVTIGGTLTYEDVTNVDSVGIVTAGKGFRATAGGLVVTAGVSTFGAIATFTQNVYANKTVFTEQGFRAIAGGLIVTAGVSTFSAIATFTSDAFVDGTLTAGLIDGGSY